MSRDAYWQWFPQTLHVDLGPLEDEVFEQETELFHCFVLGNSLGDINIKLSCYRERWKEIARSLSDPDPTL